MISNLGEQEGDGLLRTPGVLPPAARKLLSQVGSEQVQTFKLVRTPLSSATRFLLNVATLGQYEKALKDINVDKFFHLRAIINDKYSLEKNEVIRFYKSNKIESGAEVMDVIIPQNNPTTIQEMMDKTKAQMGDDKFTSYDAQTNNCGVFLNNVLSANGWLNSKASEFTIQDTEKLFSKFPSLSKMLVNLGTKLGAVASRVIEGEGHCQCGGQDEIEEVRDEEIQERPVRDEDMIESTSRETLMAERQRLNDERQNLLGQVAFTFGPLNDNQRRIRDRLEVIENSLERIQRELIRQDQRITSGMFIGTGYVDEYGDYNFQLKRAKLLF